MFEMLLIANVAYTPLNIFTHLFDCLIWLLLLNQTESKQPTTTDHVMYASVGSKKVVKWWVRRVPLNKIVSLAAIPSDNNFLIK